MKKFKIPRKTKKFLKKGLWLYPADEKGNSLMGFPTKDERDFKAYKSGVLKNLLDQQDTKQQRKAFWQKLNKEVTVSNETLQSYVNDVFRKEFQNASYDILIEAKKHPKSIKAYYNFINAYQLEQKGEGSYGNICCLAVDNAKKLIKK